MLYAYRKAWKALNTLLEEGRSYSGFERNSAFLNLGGDTPSFADISGACGLDLMEDGRSIAVVDWDYDGRRDFWIQNRTAPRLRLQHNRSVTGNSFFALKLRGKTCNRDAIGARVELGLADGSKRMATLRAGEGFLAQSTKWLHFGIAKGESIASVTVRWPGGGAETISGVESGGFFIVEQGSGEARRWEPPKPSEFSEPIALSAPSEAARVAMASPLPFPATTYLELDGEKRSTLFSPGKPKLVNLWATWCQPCAVEMKEWTDGQEALRETGIDVIALSVDDPDDPAAARAAVEPFLKRLAFPFPAGLADAEFLEVLEVAGRAQFDKFESLPVPSSILLDARGRIAVVYKGPVTVEQLQNDVKLLAAPEADRHREAAHFPGTWVEGPWPATPTAMIDKFMSFGRPEEARRYLDVFTASADARATEGVAESYFLVASELRIQKNYPEALKAYAQTLKLNPNKTRAHLDMGLLLFRMARFAEAAPLLKVAVAAQPNVENTRKLLALSLIQSQQPAAAVPHMRHLVEGNPTDAVARMWYGHALARADDAAEALAQFRESLRLQPNSPVAANELAWMLATHQDDSIRDPEEALKLATLAAEATKFQQPRVLDTLGAAQAAAGDFGAALETVKKAIGLAERTKDAKTLGDLKKRQEAYEKGRAVRE